MDDLSKFVMQIRREGIESLNRFYGLYSARVVSTADPLGQGRIWIKIPELGLDNVLITPASWLSPFGGSRVAATLQNGKVLESPLGGFGFFFPPEPDEPIVVAFRYGVLEEPIVLGSLWLNPTKTLDGSRVPSEFKPSAAGLNPTSRGIKTPAGHLLLFDDVSVNDREQSAVLRSSTGHALTLSDHHRYVVLSSAGSPVGGTVAQYGRLFIFDHEGYSPPSIPTNGAPVPIYLQPKIGLATSYDDRDTGLFCDLTDTKIELRTGADATKFRKIIIDDGAPFSLKEEGVGQHTEVVIHTVLVAATRIPSLAINGITAATPLKPGTIRLLLVSNGIERTIFDSAGYLFGFVDSNYDATINYNTGAIEATFPSALDVGSMIKATFSAIGKLTKVSGTARDGVVRLQSPTGSKIEILDTASDRIIEATTKDGQFVKLEDASPKITISTKSGFKVTLDEAGNAVEITTRSGFLVKLDEGAGQIAIKTASSSQTITLSDTAGTVNTTALTGITNTSGNIIQNTAVTISNAAAGNNQQTAGLIMSITGGVALNINGGVLTNLQCGAMCNIKSALTTISSGSGVTAPVVTGFPGGTMPICYVTGLPIAGVPTVLAGP